MKRSDFIKTLALGALTLPNMNLKSLANISKNFADTATMPMLFVGHGSPMNAILDNDFSRKWKSLGKELPKPNAILAISAHWLTHNSTSVTMMDSPRTIHDFGGFPQELFDQQYPVPGGKEYAELTKNIVSTTTIHDDTEWGLDHGTWSVLKPMFPEAEVPVYQLSIDYKASMNFHFELGKELSALRKKGVLIVGSGNIVHNLYELEQGAKVFDWAAEFDTKIASFIDQRQFEAVTKFQNLGAVAKKAHPTFDHFLPLLYILGATSTKETISYFNNSFDLGSISMRSLLIGG